MNQCLPKRITPYVGYEGFELGMSLEAFKAYRLPIKIKQGLNCYYSQMQRLDVTAFGKDVALTKLSNNPNCSGTIPTFIGNKLAYFTVFADHTGEYLTIIDHVDASCMEKLEELKLRYEYIISADGLRVLFPELGLIWTDESLKKGKEKRVLTFFAKAYLEEVKKSMGIVTVTPYKGISYGGELLEFGKTRDEIMNIDGDVQVIQIDAFVMGKIDEYRDRAIQFTYEPINRIDYHDIESNEERETILLNEAVLARVTIFEKFGYKVIIEGLDVFTSEGFNALKESYEHIDSKNKKSTLFPKLGVCVVGCGEKKNNRAGGEGKYVMAYSKVHELTPESFICVY